MAKSPRPKKDPNVTAFSIVQQFTQEAKPTPPPISLDDAEVRKQIMREMGRRGGQKGGKARAASLTKEQRSAIAKAAAKKRWASKKDKK